MTRAEVEQQLLEQSGGARERVRGALAAVPDAMMARVADLGVKVVDVGERPLSAVSQRLHEAYGDRPAGQGPAAVYVQSERTIYVCAGASEATVLHEFGHALDHALGGGRGYASMATPSLRAAYDRGETVSEQAALGVPELFAESFRAYVDKRGELEERAPSVGAYFARVDAASEALMGVPGEREPASRAKGREFRRELTDKMIAAMEAGTAPWQRPWNETPSERPFNAIRKNRYRGMNHLTLRVIAMERGYRDPRWCTYKQAQAQEWQVRRGEKGTTVEYWDFEARGQVAADDEDDEKGKKGAARRPRAFFAVVFNVEQMDAPRRDERGDVVKELVDERGVAITDENRAEAVGELRERVVMVPVVEVSPYVASGPLLEFTPVERAERIIAQSGASIAHDGGDRAYYSPASDSIHLPRREQFKSVPAYYATALHEVGHWSGHSSRLARDFGGGFGSPQYAKEELRAEIASMFLSAETGLPHDVEQHAAYVSSWIKVLQENKHELFQATRDAERIADFVLELDLEYRLSLEVGRKAEREALEQRPAVEREPSRKPVAPALDRAPRSPAKRRARVPVEAELRR